MTKLVLCPHCEVWAEPWLLSAHHARKHSDKPFTKVECEVFEPTQPKPLKAKQQVSPRSKILGKKVFDGSLVRKECRLSLRKQPSRNHVPHSDIVCPLCGKHIPPGRILEHKSIEHGEIQITPSPSNPRRPGLWISVVSGGLPSLGKHSR